MLIELNRDKDNEDIDSFSHLSDIFFRLLRLLSVQFPFGFR